MATLNALTIGYSLPSHNIILNKVEIIIFPRNLGINNIHCIKTPNIVKNNTKNALFGLSTNLTIKIL